MTDEPLILVPVPALVAVLWHRECKKGEPLTEEEVLKVRDECECIAMPVPVRDKVAEQRGLRISIQKMCGANGKLPVQSFARIFRVPAGRTYVSV